MAKAFGILLVVLGIWVGLEVYLEGSGGAFGGALARIAGDAPRSEAEQRTTPQRFGDAVERAHRDADARKRRLLED